MRGGIRGPAEVTLSSALDHTLGDLALLFTRGFEDYLVPIVAEEPWLAERIRMDGIDRGASRIIRVDGEVVGLALIARRGSTSRLAAMGIAAPARGRGVGRRAIRLLLDEARAREDRAMVLEVIEQNDPGVSLYRGAGFETVGRLVGFRRAAVVAAPDRAGAGVSDRLAEVDVPEVARQLAVVEPDPFPWQLSAETLALLGPPSRGFRLGAAWGVVSDPEEATLILRGLCVAASSQRRGEGRRFLARLLARFPGKSWKVPILVPEEVGDALFAPCGFVREDLRQLHMRIRLA